MRPLQFTIEIPERPRYVPGSGPPMAPITLQPDDRDTGWTIDSVVTYGGTPKYIVIPKDNPVHRKAVRPERILDWVSAKVYEDFEFERLKKLSDSEWEEGNKILAEAAEIKARRFSEEQSKRRARAMASRLEWKTGMGQPVQTNEYHSSTSGDSRRTPGIGNSKSALSNKRKQFTDEDKPIVKRRVISSERPGQQLKENLSARIGLRQHEEQSYGEEGEEEEQEKFSTTAESEDENIQGSAVHEVEGSTRLPPSLVPHQRSITRSTSSTNSGLGHGQTNLGLTDAIATKVVSKPHWTELGPPILVDIPSLRRAKIQEMTESLSPKAVANHLKVYPPILPPPNALRRSPKSVSVTASKSGSDLGRSFRSTQSKSRSNSEGLDLANMSPPDGDMSDMLDIGSTHGKKLDKRDKTLATASQSNIHATAINLGRSIRQLTERLESRGLTSALEPSSNRHKSGRLPKSASKPFKDNQREAKFPQGSGVENVHQNSYISGSASDTDYDINGILSSSLRLDPGTGKQSTHYLISWVGPYEPTWEPEINVSVEAVKAFKAEKAMKTVLAVGNNKKERKHRTGSRTGDEADGDEDSHASRNPDEILQGREDDQNEDASESDTSTNALSEVEAETAPGHLPMRMAPSWTHLDVGHVLQ